MAHKCLHGKKKAKKSKLRENLKAKKKVKKPIAEKTNPEAGLRKWQKKELRSKKRALDEDLLPPAKSAAVQAETRPDKPSSEVVDGQGVVGAGKKTKKEVRMQLAQERQNLALYAKTDRILLVGEGDFSFARALCRRLQSGNLIYATCFDTEGTLNRKYPSAKDCRTEIEGTFGGNTLVGVDATRIHKVKEFRTSFRKIVWNFPHIGAGETNVEKNIELHQRLLTQFFSSAVKCLDEEHVSEIHVALKSGEPYKSWKVVQIAKAAAPELEFLKAVTFLPSAWPGYSHRRTGGFDERFSKKDSEELANGAKVFVFVRRQPGDASENE